MRSWAQEMGLVSGLCLVLGTGASVLFFHAPPSLAFQTRSCLSAPLLPNLHGCPEPYSEASIVTEVEWQADSSSFVPAFTMPPDLVCLIACSCALVPLLWLELSEALSSNR